MEALRHIVDIGLAVVLFFAANWIGARSIGRGYMQLSIIARTDDAPAFNFLYRAFTPVAFMVIVAVIGKQMRAEWVLVDCYMIVAYYFVFRIAFNIALGRRLLLNWRTQCAHAVVSTGVAFYVYDQLIKNGMFFLPSRSEVGSALWIALAAYMYHTMNQMRDNGKGTRIRKDRYLDERYRHYVARFDDQVTAIAESERLRLLVYAVMIYESFNRPKICRAVERVAFRSGRSQTLGVMQVKTQRLISDRESVHSGAAKMVKDHDEAERELDAAGEPYGPETLRDRVLSRYNVRSDYLVEVGTIHDQLMERYAPEEGKKWRHEVNDSWRRAMKSHLVSSRDTTDVEP